MLISLSAFSQINGIAKQSSTCPQRLQEIVDLSVSIGCSQEWLAQADNSISKNFGKPLSAKDEDAYKYISKQKDADKINLKALAKAFQAGCLKN